MTTSNPSNSPTLPANGTPVPGAPAKRKAVRKPPNKAPRPASVRPPEPRPQETLFAEPPNPNRMPQPPYIWIDFPVEGEQLQVPAYVIRLAAGGAEAVELSIDKGEWRGCRLTSGYWWYDWAEIARGKHTLVARIRTPGGLWYRTPLRRLQY